MVEYNSHVFSIGHQLTNRAGKMLFIMISDCIEKDIPNVTMTMTQYMKLFPEKLRQLREPKQGIDELQYYIFLHSDLKQLEEIFEKENNSESFLYKYCDGYIWITFPNWFFESFRKNPFIRG